MMRPDLKAAEVVCVSSPFNSLNGHWQSADSLALPAMLIPWILEPASLTARLRRHCQQFQVQVLQQQQLALPDFLQPSLGGAQQALLREVILWCNNQPCVYAQSWLPLTTLQALAPLAQLGDTPLGDYIFQHASLTRGPIEAAVLPICLPDTAEQQCYSRRSVFQLQGHPLLVAEAFLPAMALLQQETA